MKREVWMAHSNSVKNDIKSLFKLQFKGVCVQPNEENLNEPEIYGQ